MGNVGIAVGAGRAFSVPGLLVLVTIALAVFGVSKFLEKQ
jgi:hypothetical protein